MWRLIFPLILVIAAGYVYYQGHDGDGTFLLFPFVENVVGEDPVARADASAVILLVLAAGSGLLQIVMGLRAQARRRRRKQDQRD
jgi:hypothetical protein